MRVLGLISGGKDSIFNLMECQKQGHEIVALANLRPKEVDELDSYMFQTVGHHGIEKIAEAMELPLFRKFTQGQSHIKTMCYEPTVDDEVEDLYQLLAEVKANISFDAVASGAILSDYQRIRVENVCARLNLISMSFLWRRDQSELLREMIDSNVDAILIKVAALGLDPKLHLGKTISEMYAYLLKMNAKYGLNVCGEGGEYETFTLDCPLFKHKIVIDEQKTIISSEDDIVCSVGFLHFDALHLVPKTNVLNYEKVGDRKLIESDVSDAELEEELQLNEHVIPENVKLQFNEPTASKHNKWLYISGVSGLGDTVQIGMQNAMSKLEEMVLQNNHKLENLCYINLYVKCLSDYAVINKIYCDKIKFSNPPPRVCVECPLPDNCHVLIDATAFEDATKTERYTLHVQGMSHWAPANIGPYSQLTRLNDIVLISGQIGLIPSTLTIIPGGVIKECSLTLQNIKRVAKAANNESELDDIVQGICYVTKSSHVKYVKRLIEKKTNNPIIDYVVVRGLPRCALVEMQIWMHKSHNEFKYYEKREKIDDFYAAIIRMKYDAENSIRTVSCAVENKILKSKNTSIQNFTNQTLENVLNYILNLDETFKSNEINLRVFYPANYYQIQPVINTTINNFKIQNKIITYVTIPVSNLQNSNTVVLLNCTYFK